MTQENPLSLEERIARLETLSGIGAPRIPVTPAVFALCLAFAGVGVYLCFRGFGLPNHVYQWVLGALTMALAYHRRWIRVPLKWHELLLVPANIAATAMLFKLMIGSGVRQPFFWMRYPYVNVTSSESKFQIMPSFNLTWEPTPLANLELDLTLMQTFLLLVTLIGALFRFQPFVSLTAFFLIVVSLPAFAGFDWTWVFPAMIVSTIAFYLQSSERTA